MLLGTPTGFAVGVLDLDLYPWQSMVLEEMEACPNKRVKISLVSPNGAGKTQRIVASAFLWWLNTFPKGKVVITSASGLQIDSQIYPAIKAHESKFPSFKFIDREVTTLTGGLGLLFTTDEEKRAEGHHTVDSLEVGPVLIIVDEAKSVPEGIFRAFDRCTWACLLYVSTPGVKFGRFYESQTRPELKFKTFKAGLADCPHITQEKIDDIIITYGIDAPYTRSALFAEFMNSEGELSMDREGLKHLDEMANEGHDRATIGRLEWTPSKDAVFIPDKDGWLWMDEPPTPGTRVLISCDPAMMEQSEGGGARDSTACWVIRDAYIGQDAVEHKTHAVACLHWPGGVKWNSDVLAERMALLSRFYGRAMCAIESNNSGPGLIRTLQLSHPHVPLYRRTRVDDINPSKQLKIVGFQTTSKTREYWVEACRIAVRDQSLICRYKPAVKEFHTFIITESGRSEAVAGSHDDHVAGIGIGLVVKCWTTIPRLVSRGDNGGGWSGGWSGGQGRRPGGGGSPNPKGSMACR